MSDVIERAKAALEEHNRYHAERTLARFRAIQEGKTDE